MLSNLLHSPYPWALLSALFLGAALARATRRARPRHLGDDLQRARNSKWLFFSLFLSLSIVLALGAVFVPGPHKLADRRLLYFFLACAAVFFLALRFRKSAGILVFLLILTVVLAVGLFTRALSAFTGETEIGRVKVLAVQDGQMQLEVVRPRGEQVICVMDGEYFAPVVKVVVFDDFFVFLGARTWYRFEGLTSFAGPNLRQQDTDFHFARPQGIPEQVWELFVRYERWVPGVRTVQVEMPLKKVRQRPRDLTTYSLRLQYDGGLRIVELR